MSAASSEFQHVPVLASQLLEALAPRPDGRYVDATVGGGGHASLILSRLGEGAALLGIDRDPTAIAAARERLTATAAPGDGRGADWQLVQGRFSDIAQLMDRCWGEGARADGILADLGVSSPQLDRAERGFSYHSDGPLDMRMDPTGEGPTAYELLLQSDEAELTRILRDYGEERYARRIARTLLDLAHAHQQRGETLATVTTAEAIARAMPAASRREAQHPARRSFQALRIAVNDELGELEALLDAALERLEPGGRLAIISFHSLEDRIVKQRFRRWQQPCDCPRDLPCSCGRKPEGRVLGGRGWVADEAEREANPRAQSARLRVFARN